MKKWMTAILTTILLTAAMLAPTTVLANDALAAIMKKMGADFKALGAQITNSAQNTSSLNLAQDLASQLSLAKQQTPDTVASGANTQADFQNQIGTIQDLVTQVIAALQAGDNTKAASLLATMKSDRDDSHNQFDPQTN